MWPVATEKYEWELEQLKQIQFRVERFLLMPKHEVWLRREAFIRRAYSSTMIENAAITEEELERATKELSIERTDVANYSRALEFVDFLSSEKDLVLDELIIKQIHWSLMRGIKDHYYFPGEYRKDINWIQDAGRKIYEPPHQIDVPMLMREFVVALREKELHPVLRAGLIHLHLVAIHPFVDGNGRTARLMATLLLQQSGWGFRNLLSLDAYYQRSRDEYIQALASSLGPKFTRDYDPGPWLDFFCSSVLLEAQRLESYLTEWQIIVDKLHTDIRPLGLRDRQIDGLIYAIRTGTLTRRDYMGIANVSPLTATRDMGVLVNKGFLKPEGAGRNRIYRLTIKQPGGSGKEQPRLI